jgi:rhamnosyltransferase
LAHLAVVDQNANVGLVVPTLNAGARWAECLKAIANQSLAPHRLLIIDSESTDRTTSLAKGFEIIRIKRSDYNHGGTRQRAADHLNDCEIIVFLTQDAILANRDALRSITKCFTDSTVAVAYGRQLPHIGATPIEAHARLFNYGSVTERKDSTAIPRLGSKVFFCSNSFAAYRRSVLLALGGFRPDLILGEDMEFAARAIDAGYANMYCAAATVYHSHDYTLLQTLTRYFDIGVFDAQNLWMRKRFGAHGGEGLRFVRSELRYLAARRVSLIPHSLCQTAAKVLGYRLGRANEKLPRAFRRRLSMLPSYWSD